MATGKGGGSRIFGRMSPSDIARDVKERGQRSPLERSSAQPTLAAAELEKHLAPVELVKLAAAAAAVVHLPLAGQVPRDF